MHDNSRELQYRPMPLHRGRRSSVLPSRAAGQFPARFTSPRAVRASPYSPVIQNIPKATIDGAERGREARIDRVEVTIFFLYI